jgi:biotin synthase
MSREAILLCFLAGANSIFTGERLLTTPNPASDQDAALLQDLGLRPMRLASEIPNPELGEGEETLSQRS